MTAMPEQYSAQRVARAEPEFWLLEGQPGTDFFGYANVSSTYVDPDETPKRYSELFIDNWSFVCLDVKGDIIATNTARITSAPEIQSHVSRIRERIDQGRFTEHPSSIPTALLSTARHSNYYHFLFEDLGRLGIYELLDSFDRVRLVAACSADWQRQGYALAGIDHRLLPLSPGIHRLHDVWIAPRGLISICNFRLRAFRRVLKLRDHVEVNPQTAPRRKLYISRAGTHHRRLLNEEEVQEYVQSAGFDVIRPEEYPVADQIRLFSEAEVVLGIFGAGLTNSAFMAPESLLLEIAPPRTRIPTAHNPIFSTVSGVVGLRYGLVVGREDSFDPQTHDFVLPIDWLKRLTSELVPFGRHSGRSVAQPVLQQPTATVPPSLPNPLMSEGEQESASLGSKGAAVPGAPMRATRLPLPPEASQASQHSKVVEMPGSLDEIGLRHKTDKASSHHGYLEHYERWIAPLRSQSFDMLEIGILDGASVRTWHEYFPHAQIVGVDQRTPPTDLDLDRFSFLQGSQADLAFLHQLIRSYRFRLIIDDGSHLWGHQIFSFQTLFPWLDKEGIYICEDVQTSFGALAERYSGGAEESAASYFLRLARAVAAGKAGDLKQSRDPLFHHLVGKVREIVFIRHCVIITGR